MCDILHPSFFLLESFPVLVRETPSSDKETPEPMHPALPKEEIPDDVQKWSELRHLMAMGC